jgi:arylsulfatase A-like enzyme
MKPLHILTALFIWPFTAPAMCPAAVLPNILVILCDDLGRGDYSAFGTKDIRTPHIDRLASEGMTFQNFYANSCVCSPTRAALLTGCYPDRVGVPGVIREEQPENSWGYLSREATLLPQVLRGAGYHSAIIGKWHLGTSSPNTPTERGFDFFHGFLGDMMDDYWTHQRHGHNFMRHYSEAVTPPGHATDVFTDWACEYLAQHARSLAEGPQPPAKGSQSPHPFFLYLAYNAPHDPVQPPPDWLAKVKQREPSIPEKRASLVALIEHLDAGIGKVLATLERLKLADNTLVIFTSDNGGLLDKGANNGPWRSGKTHMYEGGLRVPGVVRWPGHINPGSSTDRIALSMDIFSTACEAAGVKPPPAIDGLSFLPTLLGQTQPETTRSLYFVRREGGLPYCGKTIEALRQGPWKLVLDSPFAPLELYNLEDDPSETSNRAGQEPAVVRQLASVLRQHIQRGGVVPWQPPPVTRSENNR